MTAYQRITDSLRQRILSGQWKPGDRLPTERQLCAQYGASQITVRRALQILEEEHLVERRQGAGTFASSAAIQKIPILTTDFFGSVRRHAPRLERELHTWQWSEIDATLVEPLHACMGDCVLKATRIDRLHGQAVAVDDVTILDHYADRLNEESLGQLDFLHHWQAIQNIRLEYCSQTIEAVKARPPISQLLDVPPNDPLLKETSVVFLTGGQPAGLFVSYYRHDSFSFEVTFSFGANSATPNDSDKVRRRPS